VPERIVTARLAKRGEAEKEFDRQFWRDAGHEARFAAMWEMVAEVHLFRGQDAGEYPFEGSVQSIQRRRR